MADAWEKHVAPESEADRKARAQGIVAYLAYAIEDVRALSPTGAYLLEMSVKALSEDMSSRIGRKAGYS